MKDNGTQTKETIEQIDEEMEIIPSNQMQEEFVQLDLPTDEQHHKGENSLERLFRLEKILLFRSLILRVQTTKTSFSFFISSIHLRTFGFENVVFEFVAVIHVARRIVLSNDKGLTSISVEGNAESSFFRAFPNDLSEMSGAVTVAGIGLIVILDFFIPSIRCINA